MNATPTRPHAPRGERTPIRPQPLRLGAGNDARWYQRHSLLMVLALVLIVFTILRPAVFASPANLTSILLIQTVPLCVAMAALMPIVTGEFDLSVGYTLGFSAIVAAKVGIAAGPVAAILAALATGLVIGAVNGLLVAYLRFGSLIATLGVGLTVSGLSVGVSGSQTISAGIPPFILQLTTTPFLGIAASVWISAVFAVALYLLLSHTPFGRRMYAVGGNEKVAELAGVPTRRIKLAAFLMAGLLAACAGLFQVGLSGAANPNYGATSLLPAFAAVFLGSTAVRPGVFNVPGMVLATLILAATFSGLTLVGVPFWVEPVFDGLILLTAVYFARGRGRAGVQ